MHALAITEQGTKVHASGDTLLLTRAGNVVRQVRLGEIHQVLLFGSIEVTTAALALMARRGLDVVFLSRQGWFRCRLAGRRSQNVSLRLAQFRRASEETFAVGVARSLVQAKLSAQRKILLRAQRERQDDGLAEAIGKMRVLLQQLEQVDSLPSLRGMEGQGAALYFSQFGKLIRSPQFSFERRTRRPPRDPVNACLSFAYAMLGTMAETEVLRCGLDPLIGFFHQPDYGRPSLMLDLIEPFRPVMDLLVLRLINLRQLGVADFDRRGLKPPEQVLGESLEEWQDDLGEDIEESASASTEHQGSGGRDHPDGSPDTSPGEAPQASDVGVPSPQPAGNGNLAVYLGDTGRKIFLQAFFKRLRERQMYPPRDATLELRDIFREQVYHLARVIEGKDAGYVSFVPV